MTKTDYLEIADSLCRYIEGDQGPQVSALVSIAAALIALAERRPQFVQVGDSQIRIDRIASVLRFTDYGLGSIDGPSVEIKTVDGSTFVIQGDDIDIFLRWWADNADVVRLDGGE